MLKVALVIPALGDGSSISTPAIQTLVRGLTSEVEVHVFPVRYPVGSQTMTRDGARVHPVSGANVRLRELFPELLGKIRAEHCRSPFDVLHALWLFEPGAVAVLAGKLLRIPAVVSIGGAEVVHLPDIRYGSLQSRRGRLVIGQVVQHATLVTGGSQYILERASRLRDRGCAFQLAPLPVDTTRFSYDGRTLLAEPCAPRLLHAASLIPVKDQRTLLHAFAEIHRRLPGASLTIAGEDPAGHRNELEDLAHVLGLADSVRFLGAIPHREMPALYQAADLFLLSSRHESQGMVVLEAAASGVPTVGTAVGLPPDLHAAAVSVTPRCPGLFARAVLDVLAEPERLREMGAAARRLAEHEYSEAASSRRFIDLYHLARERHAS